MKDLLLHRLITVLLAVVLPAGIVMGQDASGPEPAEDPSLESVKEATARFQDVNVALAEGYIPDPMDLCDTADMMGRPSDEGAMGIHYFRPDLLGITATEPRVSGLGVHTDFLHPAILIYEPQADASLELVALENLVFKASWDSLNAEPPSFHGVPFDLMADEPSTAIDEAHMFEPHYDLHVWIYRENPNGIFAQFNPAVSCEHHNAKDAHRH